MNILQHSRIARFFREHGSHASGPSPLAVFDCDGTVIRGDIGEAMLYYQIEEFLFRVPPAEIWRDHPGREELTRLYGHLSRCTPEARAAHPAFGPFADMILSWYHGQIEDGRVEKACADIVRLFAGYAPADVRAYAAATLERELARPLGERTLGSRVIPAGVRFITESRDLIQALTAGGFEIWAISGSSLWSVEPVFASLGVPASRVIGIDLEVERGVLTDRALEPVPIREKKVEAMRRHRTDRPLLVASDSRNDIPLLQHSSDLKVFVSSRRKDWTVFFTQGKVTRDDSWVVVESPTTEA
jgi:phosphoserine phosphatase